MMGNKLNLGIIFVLIYCTSVALGGPSYVVSWDFDDEQLGNGEDGGNRELLGARKCTYGPSYWCHNITQAKECGAVKHCIKQVWEKQTLPEDTDDVCTVCKEMVKEARDQLLSNQTQDELRQVLEGSCHLIPLKMVANECASLMDDFIPELVDALTSRMDPQVVCSVSGLCNSLRIDEMLKEMKPIEKKSKPTSLSAMDPSSCPRCTYFMSSAFDHLKHLEKQQLRMEMLEGCGYLGSYSDSCRMAVIEEFEHLYAQVNNADSKEFCSLIGICNEQTKALAVYEPKKNGDDLPCDFCKQMINYARSWLTDNTTKEEFEKIVEGLCRQCGSHKQECINFYHQYGGEIYRLILDDLDADSFCKRIGVCPGGKSTLFGKTSLDGPSPIWTILKSDVDELQLSQPMLSLVPGEMVTGNDEKNSLKPEMMVGNDEKNSYKKEMMTGNDEKNALNESPKCTFCEHVVHEVQNYIENPKTEGTVKEFVDHLCDRYLPKEMSEQCEEFIANYGDGLIASFAEEIDPTEICPSLGLCPKKKVEKKGYTDILPTCAICQFTVTKLISLIGSNHTKESIESATERVCEMLPKRYTEECEGFMKEYGNQVLEMILIEGSSHEICAALHLCLFAPAPESSVVVQTQDKKLVETAALPAERYSPAVLNVQETSEGDDDSEENDDVEEVEGEEALCVVCEFVISTLAHNIKTNATEEEIKEEVERVCNYLPKTVQKNCMNFVEMYGDLVISYLAKQMDPSEICTELKLCKPKKSEYKLSLSRCELCTVTADYLRMKLEDPKFQKNGVEVAANKFCPLLRNLKSECKEMVEDYGPYMMSLLAQDEDKEKVCKVLDIC